MVLNICSQETVLPYHNRYKDIVIIIIWVCVDTDDDESFAEYV